MKRILLLLAIFTVAAISLPQPASAGILRTLGHAGLSCARETAHFGKSIAHDVSHDFLRWIY